MDNIDPNEPSLRDIMSLQQQIYKMQRSVDAKNAKGFQQLEEKMIKRMDRVDKRVGTLEKKAVYESGFLAALSLLMGLFKDNIAGFVRKFIGA